MWAYGRHAAVRAARSALPSRLGRARAESRAAATAPSGGNTGSTDGRALADLHRELLELSGDPLEADGGRVVVARGHPHARIVCVGEAPGADEDRVGQPFVGRSGQLLDKVFASVGLDTNQHCYVTNLVKRRPPENRDPEPHEVAFYLPFVEREIELVDPWIVVLTGRHAMRALLGEERGITKVRGEWFERDGRLYTVMFHPSYLLRLPQRDPGSPKALTWADIREIRRRLDERWAQHDSV